MGGCTHCTAAVICNTRERGGKCTRWGRSGCDREGERLRAAEVQVEHGRARRDGYERGVLFVVVILWRVRAVVRLRTVGLCAFVGVAEQLLVLVLLWDGLVELELLLLELFLFLLELGLRFLLERVVEDGVRLGVLF